MVNLYYMNMLMEKYFGITNDKTIRWRKNGIDIIKDGKYENKFWYAIQKYGWDNFEHNILLDNLTFEEACERKIEEISKYDLKKRFI
ncbi:homing endonuclease [Staphylococcus phage S-CoN_Ph17]|nr:homing endonuclease [Staphylococcus phage S-CoN_Ph17]